MATVVNLSQVGADAPPEGVPAETSSTPGSYRWVLLMRFVIINLLGSALLGAAWQVGWIDPIIATDSTHLCALIGGVFLLGWVLSFAKVWMLSYELNVLDGGALRVSSRVATYMESVQEGSDSGMRANLTGALKLKLSYRIASVRHIANSLVLLGLIGTVVGFVIALSGINPDSVADVAAIGPMVSKLLEGMGVALYTTLVGSVLNIWLMLNHRILEGGAVHLLTHLVEEGERYARSR